MKNKYNIQVSWYVHSVQSSRRTSAWEAMVRLALAQTLFGLLSQPWWICLPTVIFIWNSFLFLLISLNISHNSYFTLTTWRYNQASGEEGGGGRNPVNSWWGWECATRFSKSWPYFRPKNVIFHTRFQTCLLGRNYVIIPYIRAQTKKFFKLIFLELKRTFIHSRRYLENHTRFQTKMGKCIPVFWAKRRANPTRWGGTLLYSLHKGVPPPPLPPSLSVSPQFIETDSFIERFVKP